MIKDFEELSTVGTDREITILKDIDSEIIVRAYMGTSPVNAVFQDN